MSSRSRGCDGERWHRQQGKVLFFFLSEFSSLVLRLGLFVPHCAFFLLSIGSVFPLFTRCFPQIGTYQISLVAKALDVPFYVAVESYKFSRLYPLSQRDVMDLSDYSDPNASTAAFRNLSLQPPAMFTPSTSVRPSFNQSVPASPSKIKRSFSDLASALPANVTVEQTNIDFTPAKCITLLFTDIGVLTPAAVSDELIRLYQ